MPRSSLRPPLPARFIVLLLTWATLGCGEPPSSPAVSGKLSVLIRPPDRSQEPVAFNTPGALPARTGGAMYLEAQLEQPAFVYLLWIDASGKIRPLYPWNNEKMEVTDVAQTPPARRATNRVFSPMLGHDWTFAGPPGIETVLLLARGSALPPTVSFREILASLPPPPAPSQPDEFATYSVAPDGARVEVTRNNASGESANSHTGDEPFQQFLQHLAKHFELVRAVRFTHQDPDVRPPEKSDNR